MVDVAVRAGVSQSTVSNVVRGYPHVRPETRQRVQRAIDELRYKPHASARTLRDGRSGIIALAVPEIASPYFAELADRVQRQAAVHGITLLMDQTGAERDRELLVLDGYRTHIIDGLILSPMALSARDLDNADPGTPTVLLGERVSGSRLVSVAIDNVAAAREAVHHLLALGRRRIVALGADVTTYNVGAAVARLEGYRLAHAEAGLSVSPELVLTTSGWSRASGYDCVRGLLESGMRPDALFCFNDLLAMGAVRAVLEAGLRVPQDVAVVGWDDIEEAAFHNPSLSTVAPDKAAIAEAAVDLLVAQINGGSPPEQDVMCPYRLVVRESSDPHSEPRLAWRPVSG